MEHSFVASQLDALKCIKCKRGPIDHTLIAQCEACSNTGPCELWPNITDERAMLLCVTCIEKEREHQSSTKQEERMQAYKDTLPQPSGILNIGDMADKARAIDYSIKVREDIHNAETVATHLVLTAIDSDPNVPNDKKQWEKAKFLTERQTGYQKKIFELNAELVELQNRDRVLQQEINKLVVTLRQEERDKLRTLSPDYHPGKVKTAKETKPRASKSKALDGKEKAELMQEASKLQADGFPVDWSMLRMTSVARQMTPKQAADYMRNLMGEKK